MFRRVPNGIWQMLGSSPGEACAEAIGLLLDQRSSGPVVYTAIGRGGRKRNVRIDDDLYERMRKAAMEDDVTISEFFITAIRRYVGGL